MNNFKKYRYLKIVVPMIIVVIFVIIYVAVSLGSFQKGKLTIGSVTSDLSKEEAEAFFESIEPLLEKPDVRIETSSTDDETKLAFSLINANGESQSGWCNTSILSFEGKKYRCNADLYDKLKSYFHYPQFVGANAEIIVNAENRILYIKWKDDDLIELFGQYAFVDYKEASLNEYTKEGLKELAASDFEAGDSIAIDTKAYQEDSIIAEHIQKKENM